MDVGIHSLVDVTILSISEKHVPSSLVYGNCNIDSESKMEGFMDGQELMLIEGGQQ